MMEDKYKLFVALAAIQIRVLMMVEIIRIGMKWGSFTNKNNLLKEIPYITLS